MRLAPLSRMPSSLPQTNEPSLGELLSSIVDQTKVFARAEIDLLKLEAKDGLTKAAIGLIVVLSGAVLVGISLSLVGAAIVLARHGSPALALVTAAIIQMLIAVVAVVWLIARLKKPADTVAKTTAIANSPQHGDSVS
jgi:Putative Actinobacterial Holin-X, holin superfamily III